MRQHNYTRKLQRLIAEGKLPSEAGAMQSIDVAHDPWCRLLRKGKRCNCDPEIRVRWTLGAHSEN
jgi:hypothetical protein